MAKDLFTFATMTDGYKDVNFIELEWHLGHQTFECLTKMTELIDQINKFHLFATNSHGCKGKTRQSPHRYQTLHRLAEPLFFIF